MLYGTKKNIYLCHYGIPGMKWGQRKNKYDGLSKSDYKERKKINRLIKKDRKRTYRQHDSRIKNRVKVNQEYNKERLANKKITNSWSKAATAYKTGDMEKYVKHLSVYNKEMNKLSMKYNKKGAEAFIKDLGLTKISDINKQYIYDVNSGKKTMPK